MRIMTVTEFVRGIDSCNEGRGTWMYDGWSLAAEAMHVHTRRMKMALA